MTFILSLIPLLIAHFCSSWHIHGSKQEPTADQTLLVHLEKVHLPPPRFPAVQCLPSSPALSSARSTVCGEDSHVRASPTAHSAWRMSWLEFGQGFHQRSPCASTGTLQKQRPKNPSEINPKCPYSLWSADVFWAEKSLWNRSSKSLII